MSEEGEDIGEVAGACQCFWSALFECLDVSIDPAKGLSAGDTDVPDVWLEEPFGCIIEVGDGGGAEGDEDDGATLSLKFMGGTAEKAFSCGGEEF